MLGIKFLGLPYTQHINVDFEGKEAYTVPSGIVICEMRVVADACDTFFQVRVDLEPDTNKDGVPFAVNGVSVLNRIFKSFGQDIWNVRVRRVFRLTTSKAVINNIELLGYTEAELRQY